MIYHPTKCPAEAMQMTQCPLQVYNGHESLPVYRAILLLACPQVQSKADEACCALNCLICSCQCVCQPTLKVKLWQPYC
uniref:Uncharacterized protein n=1 Tax=Anguilla anguilla TaxID=7936 RepID=A0A0E9PXC0_ANGAN